jgi:DNA recombination-dependent growth factor C
MPLLSGAMGARRYRVLLAPDPVDRDAMLDRLSEHAFREPVSAARGGETFGWVSLHNPCVTEFSTENTFYNQYFCFALRVDQKRIPGRLLRALLDLRVQAWRRETGRERIPASVKAEIREQLELELFPRQLPALSVQDVCWNVQEHVLWFFNNGEKSNERFRTLFARTFQLETRPFGALQLIAEHDSAGRWLPALDAVGHSDYRPAEGR